VNTLFCVFASCLIFKFLCNSRLISEQVINKHSQLFAVHELVGFVTLVLCALQTIFSVVTWIFNKEDAVKERFCIILLFRNTFHFVLPRHLLGGFVCLSLLTLSVSSGATYYQAILDLSLFPWDFHKLRYSFVYMGLNFIAIVVGLCFAILLYILFQQPKSYAYEPIN
jgi:hypothetical protein